MKNMYKILNGFFLSILIFLSLQCKESHIQYFRDGISIKENWIFVDQKPFFIHGVGYAGWRPGQWPGTDVIDLNLVELDFQRIKEAGFNTIRTWEALSPQELNLAKKYDLKVIQGIWIDPNQDFSDPVIIKITLDKVQKVVEWSKDFKNILMYLVMTEPTQQAVVYSGEEKMLEFFKKVKATIQAIDNKPVSMDSWIPIGFLDHSIWDVVTFNAFAFTPRSINETMGFENYIKWIKRHHARNKPLLIGETGGFSVSPQRLNDLGFGSNTEEEQSRNNIESLKKVIQSQAAGYCLVSWIDTWHYPSDPDQHDPHPWEWDGIIGFKDKYDSEGYPRRIYFDFKNFVKDIQIPFQDDISKSPFRVEMIYPLDRIKDEDDIILRLSYNHKPLVNHSVKVGLFSPMDWQEITLSMATNEKGDIHLDRKILKSFRASPYLIVSLGIQYEGSLWGDLKFIPILSAQKQFQKDQHIFFIYKNQDFPGNHFVSSGWMGDDGNLNLDGSYQDGCYDKSCLRIQYRPKENDEVGWAGIVWQNTLNNWFDSKYAFDLQEYRKFSFWTRGENGGEVIAEIGLGGASPNSDDIKKESIVLGKEWRHYEIDLREYDLIQIIHGLKVILKEKDNPKGAVILLDEVMLSKD